MVPLSRSDFWQRFCSGISWLALAQLSWAYSSPSDKTPINGNGHCDDIIGQACDMFWQVCDMFWQVGEICWPVVTIWHGNRCGTATCSRLFLLLLWISWKHDLFMQLYSVFFLISTEPLAYQCRTLFIYKVFEVSLILGGLAQHHPKIYEIGSRRNRTKYCPQGEYQILFLGSVSNTVHREYIKFCPRDCIKYGWVIHFV